MVTVVDGVSPAVIVVGVTPAHLQALVYFFHDGQMAA